MSKTLRSTLAALFFAGALFAPASEAKAQSAQELEATFNAFFALGFFLETLRMLDVPSEPTKTVNPWSPSPSKMRFQATSRGTRFRVPCVTEDGRQGKRWNHLPGTCRSFGKGRTSKGRMSPHLAKALQLREWRKAREAAALLPPPVEVNAEVSWLTPKRGGSK